MHVYIPIQVLMGGHSLPPPARRAQLEYDSAQEEEEEEEEESAQGCLPQLSSAQIHVEICPRTVCVGTLQVRRGATSLCAVCLASGSQ